MTNKEIVTNLMSQTGLSKPSAKIMLGFIKEWRPKENDTGLFVRELGKCVVDVIWQYKHEQEKEKAKEMIKVD